MAQAMRLCPITWANKAMPISFSHPALVCGSSCSPEIHAIGSSSAAMIALLHAIRLAVGTCARSRVTAI